MKKTGNVHSLKLRVTALVLALLVCFYVLPSTALAEAASKGSVNAANAAGSESDEGGAEIPSYTTEKTVFEVEELREASVKHFRLEDGSFIAASYPSQIHRLDENGLWQDIDNVLEERGSEVSTSDARIKFAKKITGNKSLFTLHGHNTKISMALVGAKKKTEAKITGDHSSDEGETTALGKLMNLEKFTSSLVYEDILDGVDVEYVVSGLSLKENIIVKEKKEHYSYSFKLSLNNLTASLNADGSVSLTDGEGEAEYSIPAPLVYDSDGVIAPKETAGFTLTDHANGSYTLTVTVSPEWMNAAERAYPVTVDPTIQEQLELSADMTLGLVWQNDPYYTPATLNNRLPLNNQYASAIYMKSTIPNYCLNSDIIITDARFYIELLEKVPTNYIPKLRTYQVISNWSQDTPQAMFIGGQAGLVGAVVEGNITPSGNRYSLNVTRLTQKWVDGVAPNYGIVVEMQYSGVYASALFKPTVSFTQYPTGSGGGNEGGGEEVVPTSNSDPTPTPIYTVSYVKSSGLESYWSYSSQSAGNAGSGNVNLSNGNLVYTIDTLSTTDHIMPLTLSLVYNTCQINAEHNASNILGAAHSRYLPSGFKLNIDERIVKTEVDGQTKYLLSDSDGTEHYYSAIEGSTVKYLDESGKRTVLDTSSEGSYLYITDVDNTKRTYKRYETSENYETAVWILTKIEDKHANSVSFTLGSSGNPTAVSFKPNGSSAIPMLKLTYNSSGMLSLVYNLTTQKGVRLEYSSNRLSKVTYLSGTHEATTEANWTTAANGTAVASITTEYYVTLTNSSGKLVSVTDSLSGSKIVYAYNTASKVTSAKEYGRGSLLGQTVSFIYGSGYTDVRTSGSDDAINTSDDIITRYVFDDQGRAVSYYSTNADGTEIYGAVSGSYEDQENIKNNVKETTAVGGSPVNYIMNGGFGVNSFDSSYWTTTSNVGSSNGLFEHYHAVFTVTQGSADHILQNVLLGSGDYTLSFEYMAVNLPSNTVISLNATAIASSGARTVLKTKNIEGNSVLRTGAQVASMTFNVPSDNTKVEIKIAVSGASSTNGELNLDNVVLAEGILVQPFSYVLGGHLEDSAIAANGSSVSSNTLWKDQNGANSELEELSEAFGASVKLSANNSSKYVKQRVYSAPTSKIGEFDNSPSTFVSNANSSYIVSGYGYTSDDLTENGTFEIRVDVYYYQGEGLEDVLKSYSFKLQNVKGTWQFTSGGVSTKYYPSSDDTNDYRLVHYIDIVCDFSNQANGSAYFDGIAFSDVSENSQYKYYYYEDGNLARKESFFDTTYYEYKSGTNLVSVMANNNGEIWEYKYNSQGAMVSEVYSTFERTDGATGRMAIYYPYFYENPHDHITTRLISMRENSYNNYGLLNGTNYGEVVIEDDEYMYPGHYISKTYTYNTSTTAKNFGAITSETDGFGNTVRYFYDSSTLMLKATVNTGTGSGSYYTYDSKGRISKVTPAVYTSSSLSSNESAEKVSYTYDAYGNLSKITTASTVYTFSYDAYGNSTSVKAGSNTLASYEYNSNNGKLKKVTYGNGFIEEYVYNDLENLSEVWYTYSNGTRVKALTYVYAAEGPLHRVDDLITGKSTIYSYTAGGKVDMVFEADTETLRNFLSVRSFYDDEGRVDRQDIDIDYSVGTGTALEDLTYYYTYNDDGTLAASTIDASEDLNISYGYDKLKRNSIQTYASSNYSNTVIYTYETSSFTYTSTRVKTYKTTVGNNSTTYTYTYDSMGNITTISRNGSLIARYKYDDLGQLIREDSKDFDRTFVYVYDNAGNRVRTEKYYYTTADDLSNASSLSPDEYTYSGDRLSEVTYVTLEYDSIGNPTKYRRGFTTFYLTWEGRKLMSVENSSGDVYTFTYNADGLRTSKTYTYNETVQVTNYYYSGSLLIAEEKDGEMQIYLYDSTGSPIGIQVGTGASATTYWFEKNLQGDIVAVYDQSGNKLIDYFYTAFGNFKESGSIAVTNPFLYRGYYYDQDLGFYYLGSRYYDYTVGRFINEDKFVSTGQSFSGYNMYSYCGNNPITRVDPMGDAWWHWAIGAAIVVACAVAVVATAGGAAAGVAAVVSVANGVAAATTASTIAAGAFIGASLSYGSAAFIAMSESNSIEEFNDNGNWETVGSTVVGVLTGGAYGFCVAKAQLPQAAPSNPGKDFQPGGPTIQEGVNPNTLIPSKDLTTLSPKRIHDAVYYGGNQAISVTKTGVILDGHHRVSYAIKNGQMVDVIVEVFK